MICAGEQPGWQRWLGGLLVVIGMLLTGPADPRAARRSNKALNFNSASCYNIDRIMVKEV